LTRSATFVLLTGVSPNIVGIPGDDRCGGPAADSASSHVGGDAAGGHAQR
jgi:hypothetical protein